jgi:flagellar basal body rod protein FlgF
VVIAGLACGSEVTTTLNDSSIYANNLANEVTHGQPEAFLTKIQEYTAKRDAITKAMRKEIGNDSEPMFLST